MDGCSVFQRLLPAAVHCLTHTHCQSSDGNLLTHRSLHPAQPSDVVELPPRVDDAFCDQVS